MKKHVHFGWSAIRAFAEGAQSDRKTMAAEIAQCDVCRATLEEVDDFLLLFGADTVLQFLDDSQVDADREPLRDALLAHELRVERDVSAADAFFSELMRHPLREWSALLESRRSACTAPLVHRLLLEVGIELDRRPEQALALLNVAELVAFSVEGDESRVALGDVWKQRSNAYRQLGRYEEAVDCARMAEEFYVAVKSDFDVAQARYTAAAALFKMTRYEDALQKLHAARETLVRFGETAPLAKALMLDAIIRGEQGDVSTAKNVLLDLLPVVRVLKQPLEIARVLANLAECNLRLGLLDDAEINGTDAVAAFAELGNDVEVFRVEWTLAMVGLARGEDTLAALTRIALSFEARGVSGDAGFVRLDIVEELVRREAWQEAQEIVLPLATLFTAAGVSLASVTAIEFLKQAVTGRQATGTVVQYVRRFVADDDPAQTFAPPP
jgi:tetratricopeptide (TPR) repeat protein